MVSHSQIIMEIKTSQKEDFYSNYKSSILNKYLLEFLELVQRGEGAKQV